MSNGRSVADKDPEGVRASDQWQTWEEAAVILLDKKKKERVLPSNALCGGGLVPRVKRIQLRLYSGERRGKRKGPLHLIGRLRVRWLRHSSQRRL